MCPDLKPIQNQTIVITGASSGIGLTTARMAAERGARVVLAARSEDALQEATEEIREAGGRAEYVVADVSDPEDVEAIATTAEETFGDLDTWVNAAAVFIYGRLAETPMEEMRAQFDVNVWGLLDGSLTAAEHLRDEGGGAIVNVGSIVSDRAFPLQGSYSASKHAVKGFTDALRVELAEEGTPVSVTLVKPSATDTPYPEHAKNYMDERATLPPPVYAPETVARAILDAAERPRREVTVGGGGKALTALARLAPGLMDTVMERLFVRLQRTDEPARPRQRNTLDEPTERAQERGDYDGTVRERSRYTAARRRSTGKLLAVGLGLGAAAAWVIARGGGLQGGTDRRDETDRRDRTGTVVPGLSRKSRDGDGTGKARESDEGVRAQIAGLLWR